MLKLIHIDEILKYSRSIAPFPSLLTTVSGQKLKGIEVHIIGISEYKS